MVTPGFMLTCLVSLGVVVLVVHRARTEGRSTQMVTEKVAVASLSTAERMVSEGDHKGALRALLSVVRGATDENKLLHSQVFRDCLHTAGTIYRTLGDTKRSLSMLQLEKFCYEGSLLCCVQAGEGGEEGRVGGASLSEVQCKHFVALSQMFLENRNPTMVC